MWLYGTIRHSVSLKTSIIHYIPCPYLSPKLTAIQNKTKILKSIHICPISLAFWYQAGNKNISQNSRMVFLITSQSKTADWIYLPPPLKKNSAQNSLCSSKHPKIKTKIFYTIPSSQFWKTDEVTRDSTGISKMKKKNQHKNLMAFLERFIPFFF